MDAAVTGETVVVATRKDSLYPLFSAAAAKAGINHVLSVGMPVPGRVVGGLNFYTTAEDPVDEDTRTLVATFAGFAAVAVANAAVHMPVLCADGEVRSFAGRLLALSDSLGVALRALGALAIYSPTGTAGLRPFG